MYCKTCKKEQPVYEMFDGKFYCVKCKNEIKFETFCVNPLDDEDFELSEILFHDALRILADGNDYGKMKEARRHIERAVALCKQAAINGHPKAILRLAYYYETGNVKTYKINGYKLACSYYKRIFSYESKDKVGGMDEAEFCKLSKIAETRYSNLSQSISAKTADFSENMCSILDACMQTELAPIFGVIGVRLGALNDWAYAKRNASGSDDRTNLAYYTNESGLNLYFSNGSESYWLKDTSNIEGQEDAKVQICFINSRNRKFSGCKSYLTKNGEVAITHLISKQKNTQQDFVFYPDDVLRFQSKLFETVAHATKNLVDYVLGI